MALMLGIERASAKKGRGSRNVRVYTKKELAAKRERYLVNNRQAAHKSREKKKTWVTSLLERVELSIANNAKLPYEIVQSLKASER
jgi:hypothetical protein